MHLNSQRQSASSIWTVAFLAIPTLTVAILSIKMVTNSRLLAIPAMRASLPRAWLAALRLVPVVSITESSGVNQSGVNQSGLAYCPV